MQHVDVDALMRLATEHDLIVRADVTPGSFVAERGLIATAYPRDRVSDEVTGFLQAAFVIGQERTPEQEPSVLDPPYRQIAQRACRPESTTQPRRFIALTGSMKPSVG